MDDKFSELYDQVSTLMQSLIDSAKHCDEINKQKDEKRERDIKTITDYANDYLKDCQIWLRYQKLTMDDTIEMVYQDYTYEYVFGFDNNENPVLKSKMEVPV